MTKNKGDLISRSKLLISVLAMIGHNNEIVTQDKVLGWVQGVDNCRELIENAPTVEPLKIYEFKGCDNCELERPKGTWRVYEGVITCEKCGEETEEKTPFCAWCGADMRKPNCVRCDHFGDCDGCEKGEEE